MVEAPGGQRDPDPVRRGPNFEPVRGGRWGEQLTVLRVHRTFRGGATLHSGRAHDPSGRLRGLAHRNPTLPARGSARRGRCLTIAGPAAAVSASVSQHAPVRRAIDRAMEPGRVDKRLPQQQRMAEPNRAGQSRTMRRAHRPSPREPRLRWRGPGNTDILSVVRHQMKASTLDAEVPPDPAVACPTLQRSGREHRQGEPRTAPMRDVPNRGNPGGLREGHRSNLDGSDAEERS